LGFLADTNPSIIRAYEDRRKKIEEMERSKVDKERELVSLSTELQDTKNEWLGPLTDLVDRINDNFSGFFATMNCAGQIALDHGEDEVFRNRILKTRGVIKRLSYLNSKDMN